MMGAVATEEHVPRVAQLDKTHAARSVVATTQMPNAEERMVGKFLNKRPLPSTAGMFCTTRSRGKKLRNYGDYF